MRKSYIIIVTLSVALLSMSILWLFSSYEPEVENSVKNSPAPEKISELSTGLKTINVGLDNWPPFGIERSVHPGISVEIIREVYEQAGYNVKIVFMPWPRVEEASKELKIDVMGNLYKIPSIEEWADYSKAYHNSKVKLAARQNFSKNISSIKDLDKERIGMGIGYSFGEEFDNAANVTKVPVQLTLNALQMLGKERVDLVIDSEEVLKFYLKSDKELKARVKILDYTVSANEMCIGVNKLHPDSKKLINIFNRNLQVLKENGTLAEILDRYVSD